MEQVRLLRVVELRRGRDIGRERNPLDGLDPLRASAVVTRRAAGADDTPIG